MAKRRRKRKTTARKKRGPRLSMPALDWLTVRRGLVAFTWVVGLGGIAAGWVLGVPRLAAYASTHQTTRTLEVRFVDPPAWITGELEAWLVLTAQRQIDADPLNREALIAAREALLATGCFAEIAQVRRVRRDLVEVDAQFLVPFAVIRDEGIDHLVDKTGRLLPAAYRLPEDHSFITIRNVHFARPARTGDQWPGSDVTAALRLLRLIESRPWKGQVVQIDVNDYQRAMMISLVTDRGGRIIWGAAPGDEGAREVPAEQKLAYLDRHDRDYQHIDRGCRILNITGDVVSCQ